MVFLWGVGAVRYFNEVTEKETKAESFFPHFLARAWELSEEESLHIGF